MRRTSSRRIAISGRTIWTSTPVGLRSLAPRRSFACAVRGSGRPWKAQRLLSPGSPCISCRASSAGAASRARRRRGGRSGSSGSDARRPPRTGRGTARCARAPRATVRRLRARPCGGRTGCRSDAARRSAEGGVLAALLAAQAVSTWTARARRARLGGGDEVEEEDAVGTPRESDDDGCVGGEADGARELQPARRGERAGVSFRRTGSARIRRKGERGSVASRVVFAARLRGKAAPVRGGGRAG
jgi:hypothetical protein